MSDFLCRMSDLLCRISYVGSQMSDGTYNLSVLKLETSVFESFAVANLPYRRCG